jgi:hypothetical protein
MSTGTKHWSMTTLMFTTNIIGTLTGLQIHSR